MDKLGIRNNTHKTTKKPRSQPKNPENSQFYFLASRFTNFKGLHPLPRPFLFVKKPAG